MRLPEFIGGFAFRFLKIVLNSEGIKFNPENNNYIPILLKAYLVFVIIHEQNHYMLTNINNILEKEIYPNIKCILKDPRMRTLIFNYVIY